jgi:hypothetical protein
MKFTWGSSTTSITKTGWIPPDDLFSPFLHKRRSFEHEREIRAIIARYPPVEDLLDPPPSAPGTAVPVDLDELVEAIRVAPLSPSWYFEVVMGTAVSYGLKVIPSQSDLDAAAVF